MTRRTPDASAKPGIIRDFFTGVRYIGQGMRLWSTAPRLMLLGAIPALIVAILYVTAFITLGINIEAITAWVTPFAEEWDEPWRTGIRIVAMLAFLAVAVLLVIYTFTTLTLIVGDPFYERIWQHVEDRFEVSPDSVHRGFWISVWRGIGAAVRMLIPAIFIGLALFLLGFVPLVGQIAAPVLGAFFGGWFLTVELTGLAFDSRGKSLRERRAALRARRSMTLGFGVATYLLFLIPLGAVIVMPAAVAGATLLSRRALGESTALATKP